MPAPDESFEAFIGGVAPRLRREFLGTRGADGGQEAVAEALSWAWEHWTEVQAMENPAGYLYRVGQSRTRPPRSVSLPQPVELGIPDFEPRLLPALLELPET